MRQLCRVKISEVRATRDLGTPAQCADPRILPWQRGILARHKGALDRASLYLNFTSTCVVQGWQPWSHVRWWQWKFCELCSVERSRMCQEPEPICSLADEWSVALVDSLEGLQAVRHARDQQQGRRQVNLVTWGFLSNSRIFWRRPSVADAYACALDAEWDSSAGPCAALVQLAFRMRAGGRVVLLLVRVLARL